MKKYEMDKIRKFYVSQKIVKKKNKIYIYTNIGLIFVVNIQQEIFLK